MLIASHLSHSRVLHFISAMTDSSPSTQSRMSQEMDLPSCSFMIIIIFSTVATWESLFTAGNTFNTDEEYEQAINLALLNSTTILNRRTSHNHKYIRCAQTDASGNACTFLIHIRVCVHMVPKNNETVQTRTYKVLSDTCVAHSCMKSMSRRETSAIDQIGIQYPSMIVKKSIGILSWKIVIFERRRGKSSSDQEPKAVEPDLSDL